MINPPKFVTVVNALAVKTESRAEWFEPHGCLQSVVDFPAKGVIRHIRLGGHGLQILHGDRLVVIPTQVLLTAAEAADEGMKAPGQKVLEENERENQKLIGSLTKAS